MSVPVNGARGEVGLKIGDVEIVIAATMGGLAAASTELGCKSLQDLFERLSMVEVAAAQSGIRHLTVRGDASAALAALKLSHFNTLSKAFEAALGHHFSDDLGNVPVAATTS